MNLMKVYPELQNQIECRISCEGPKSYTCIFILIALLNQNYFTLTSLMFKDYKIITV